MSFIVFGKSYFIGMHTCVINSIYILFSEAEKSNIGSTEYITYSAGEVLCGNVQHNQAKPV